MEFDPDMHAAVIETMLRRAIEQRRRLPIIAGNGDMLIVKMQNTEMVGAHFLGTITWLNQEVVTAVPEE